ncbi:MAG: SpoIIE family protein phosphatase [Spirochaetaceae bacterium]|jgi:serine phosphatase RsbU (regulator of sigma subunit)|nr:SpoIIE family protein phosphatase [Spirochaetaceae bacterium]
MMRIKGYVSLVCFFGICLCMPGSVRGLSDFYWEEPELFVPEPGSFPVSAYNDQLAVVAWQETDAYNGSGDGRNGNARNGDAHNGSGLIFISLAVKTPGNPWRFHRSIGEPYSYSGTEPAILSITLDSRNRILIAAAASSTQTDILISEDLGESFTVSRVDSGTESAVAPRIYSRTGGGYFLFVSRGREQSLSIYYARSEDGRSWTSFSPFITEEELLLTFLPVHIAHNGTDFVVFQSIAGSTGQTPAFQLFLKSSSDGGRTWTSAKGLTNFTESRMNTGVAPDRFDNQRPHLSVQGNKLFLVWERRLDAGSPQIYGVFIREDGSLAGSPERINSDEAYCNNPIAFQYQGETTVTWVDNRRGANRVFLAQRGETDWRNHELSGSSGEALFARPVISGGELFLFWQFRSRNIDRIYVLAPDNSVMAPRLSARNFSPGRRGRGDRVRISWDIPSDPSGILGFSYLWSQDQEAVPEKRIISSTGNTEWEEIAAEDGSWYFAIIAQDFAGNWSSPARIEYIRDTTPPPMAVIIRPPMDAGGYLLSNSFDLQWNPPPASDIAGYTWNLQYLGPTGLFGSADYAGFVAAAARRFPETRPPAPRIMGRAPVASYANQDNGVWRFTVSAIDEVGNIGPPSTLFFRTDKYLPRTYITYVDASRDEQGILGIRILGRGFAEGGAVTRVYLDRDGKAPYDREYYLSRGDYRVLSDREIAGLRIDDIEEGRYLVGVEHPLRGVYVTTPLLAVDETGTIKFGDFSRVWQPSWFIRPRGRFILDTVILIIAGILLFCVIGLAASIRGIGAVMTEGTVINAEVAALITGDLMPREKKKRLTVLRRRGGGLRLKLASFTIVLVLLVVGLVSAPLYLMITRSQEETLFQGLLDRSTVLLEGLATSARAYLPTGNILELGLLSDQIASIPEARYVTITGFGLGSTIFDDHVWATNDPDILAKIDTAELEPGVSRLEDILSPRLAGITRELNDRARTEAGDLSLSINGFTQEALSLALRTDEESRLRLNDIRVSIRTLEMRLTEILGNISREIGSEPAFSGRYSPGDGNRYIFFKPVLYRQGTEDIYCRGLVRLEISIDLLLKQIDQERQDILKIILLVALIAITIGIAGALILSTLIVSPIRRLVSHVELIRDTEDKAQLEGVDIRIRSRDELEVLGATINDMTHRLVKAAQDSHDLTIGREVQKKFIPLETDREGNKLTSGFKDTRNAQFFGYYEGAKGVSGDYFDYLDLDGRYFAIIKCDVAGKGVPAALIMIQVATMFLNYFKTWKPTPKGMHIEDVVYQINDFIEALGFKGRFAAFTLCLFDSQTGLIHFCNAGDNIIHWFDASERRMKTRSLRETPATGVLPNFLVESKGGYIVQNVTIDHGDILFLYTDGIEEAKRRFRDANFEEILCTEGPPGSPHANHVAGQGDEELGADRVEAIINAVMNRQIYTLHKHHNPEGERNLEFDFSTCEGRVEEAIMALVSVEKVFRLYKDPEDREDSLVLVDKKVDKFLRDHFFLYRHYCGSTREIPNNEGYMYYTRVKEDAQYDDLTIIGIKRK